MLNGIIANLIYGNLKLENSDAVIHLAGINLFSKRWNESFKKAVLESREVSTKNLVEAIKSCANKPEVFISASGIGYYGDCGETYLMKNHQREMIFLPMFVKYGKVKHVKLVNLESEMFKLEPD